MTRGKFLRCVTEDFPGDEIFIGRTFFPRRAGTFAVRRRATTLLSLGTVFVITNMTCPMTRASRKVRLRSWRPSLPLARRNLIRARYALPAAMPFCEPEGVIVGAGLVTACE